MLFFFFFNDTATTEIYTLSLHDALPISAADGLGGVELGQHPRVGRADHRHVQQAPVAPEEEEREDAHPEVPDRVVRSEEHTSELQSRQYLVCRLLLEKKKKITHTLFITK